MFLNVEKACGGSGNAAVNKTKATFLGEIIRMNYLLRVLFKKL